MKVSKSRRGSRSNRIGYAVAGAVASLLTVQSAMAQPSPANTWTGGAGDNLWTSTGNWSLGAVPFISGAHADEAIFPSGLGALNITVATSPAQSTGQLHFQNTAATTLTTASGSMNLATRYGILVDSGAGAVTVTHPSGTAETINTNGTTQSFINNSTSTLTIASNVGNVNNAGSTLTVDGPGPIVLGGGFSDRKTGSNPQPTTNVIKNGTGSIELQAGTFIGSMTMNSGTIRFRSNTAFGTGTKTITFNGGLISAVVSDRTIAATSSWVIGGDVNWGGLGNTLTVAGNTDLGGVNRGFDVGTLGGGAGNVIFSGVVSNGAITKTGPNNLTMNTASTYAGGTNINGGPVQLTNAADIVGGVILNGPLGTGTVTINNTGVLRSNTTTSRTLQNNVVVNGNVTLGASTSQTGALTFNSTDGTDALATPATFTVGSTSNVSTLVDVTIANPLSGAGNLTKSGDHDLTLSFNNSSTYTGGITVSAGRLIVQTPGALGDSVSGTSVTSGGELLYSGAAASATEAEPLTLAGPGSGTTSGGALTVGNTAVMTFTAPITLAGDATIHTTGTGSATYSNSITGTNTNLTIRGGAGGTSIVNGAISLGAGALIKDQGSTWTLAGNNTWTGGTNIIAGVLTVGNGGSTGNLGTGNITNAGALNFNRSDTALSVSDVISGAGSVSQIGSGTTTLTGTNTYTGGTNVSAGKLIVNRMHEGNAVNITGGTLEVADSSPTLPSIPAGNNASYSRPSSLTIANDGGALGVRVYNGTLDLGNNDLILDYPDGGPNPAADIEDMVRSGFNASGMAWQGTGITSSTAANVMASGNYALAVADNALLTNKFGDGTGGKPQFDGQSVDDSTVIVKFTHRVDLDLDGFVTPNDAIIFATNYIQNGNGNWITGDVDYDGKHTQNDAIIFATFYNGTLPSLPEPGIATVALGAAGLLLRRGRRA